MSDERDGNNLLRYVSVGTEFIVVFGAFLAGGLALDYRLDTLPGFTLLGAAVGFGLGMYRLVTQGNRMRREAQRRQRRDDRTDDQT